MRFAVLLALALALRAEAPSRIECKCTNEDIQELDLECSAEQPCPVYLEFAALETVANRVFLTGNLHTKNATLSSILLASDDGGRTWSEPHPRVRGAVLEQIQFIDLENGWIGGQTVQPAPRDPFLLITHDAGKTWQMRPVFEESNRTGAIEQFWFDSRTSGSLLVDRIQAGENGARHELYESMTGGESWSLRQASASTIKLARSRPESTNPDWRIRADAATKSYRVEKRDSGQWKTIAAFAIQPGECRPPERTLTEAPPETPAAEEKTTEDKSEAAPGPSKGPRTPPTLRKKRRLSDR
jgi:photosystem II stability/assembly factor-like uncharacterized protein